MKIATWNVNSIKVRLEHLIKWMDLAQIDAAVLQETKTVDELFPLAELQAAGFDAVFLGQKTYNGVALVTRKSSVISVSNVIYNIPGYPEIAFCRCLCPQRHRTRQQSLFVQT